MIDEERQDLAAAYALDALDAAAARAFEAELATDAELRALVSELRESAAALAHASPRRIPAPELRERILSAVRAEAVAAGPPIAPRAASSGSTGFFLPWGLAAGFALATAALWLERDQWRGEALELRNRDAFSQVRIATLSAQVEAYSASRAVVVWDPEKQRGMIQFAKVPRPASGKDYQLWVIDPKYPKPISGGIVPVGADGVARVSFTTDQPVRRADKFAISVEPAGGMPVATGPIVLLGE